MAEPACAPTVLPLRSLADLMLGLGLRGIEGGGLGHRACELNAGLRSSVTSTAVTAMSYLPVVTPGRMPAQGMTVWLHLERQALLDFVQQVVVVAGGDAVLHEFERAEIVFGGDRYVRRAP